MYVYLCIINVIDLYILQYFIYILYDFIEILDFGKVVFKQNKNGSNSLFPVAHVWPFAFL